MGWLPIGLDRAALCLRWSVSRWRVRVAGFAGLSAQATSVSYGVRGVGGVEQRAIRGGKGVIACSLAEEAWAAGSAVLSRLPDLQYAASVNSELGLSSGVGLTIEALGCSNGLQQSVDGLQAALEVVVLGLDGVSGADNVLQLLEGLLALQLLDTALQSLNLVLGPLANGALGFAVVRALLGQLLRGQIGNTARRCTVCLAFPAILHGGIVGGRCVGGWGVVLLVVLRRCSIARRAVHGRHVDLVCLYKQLHMYRGRVMQAAARRTRRRGRWEDKES